jgi:hypothetical protein
VDPVDANLPVTSDQVYSNHASGLPTESVLWSGPTVSDRRGGSSELTRFDWLRRAAVLHY